MGVRAIRGLACLGLFILGTQGKSSNADELRYGFKSGENRLYEVSISRELPTKKTTQSHYLLYLPRVVDERSGKTTLNYAWIMRENRTDLESSSQITHGDLGALAKASLDKAPKGSDIIVDSRGNVLEDNGANNQNVLDSGLGSAWKLLLQPLPAPGKTTWTTVDEEVVMAYDKSEPKSGPNPAQVTRVTVPFVEKVVYTASIPEDGLVTIRRDYDLSSIQRVGDAPAARISGDGQYVFDLKTRLIQSLKFNLTEQINQKNFSVKIPLTVTAKLLSTEEVAQLQVQIDQDIAKHKADEEKRKVDDERRRVEQRNDLKDVPEGMTKTEMPGADQGRPYIKVSPDRVPLLGFKIQNAEWGGNTVFRSIEPLYENVSDKKPEDIVIFAKDGYAVGAITVNAKEFTHAFNVTFMKKTDKGLDPKDSYTSPWYGKPADASRKKLGGSKGEIVYGIFGRRGMNVHTLGLVIEAPPAE